MAFFKFRSSGPKAGEGRNANMSTAPAESVDAMRRRARHRLLGAAILVLLGVIGFPLLFDTQPRPVAVDIPIEIPDRNKVAPLAIAPPTPSNVPGASERVVQAPATTSSNGNGNGNRAVGSNGGVITESQDGTELPSDRPVTTTQPDTRAAIAPRPETHAAIKPEVKPKPEPKSEPAKTAAAKPPAADDGARARALLDGKAASAAPVAATAAPAANAAVTTGDAGRFVIQVGAFADDAKAREVRQKLEKAGLKTYTNVAKTAEGDRTRVRVGPFASRAEADRVAGKVKGLSLPASVLSL